jgi:hypothetical protein
MAYKVTGTDADIIRRAGSVTVRQDKVKRRGIYARNVQDDKNIGWSRIPRRTPLAGKLMK